MRLMRFLIVGLGSMGKRRVRNLLALGERDIVAFDIRTDRRAEAGRLYGVATVDSFEGGMAAEPEAVIISSPPHLHLDYALAALRAGKHIFTEINCPQSLAEMDSLIEASRAANVVAAPSCTLRYHPALKKIKDLVDEGVIGKVLACTYHSGNYLPNWHPWEDYRAFYVARRETGGGRDQVSFELEPIRWIMGEVRTVAAMAGKLSSLEIDAFDVYQILLGFESGALGHLLMDLIQQPPNRTFRLVSEEGMLWWDWRQFRLWMYRAKDDTWRDFTDGPGLKGWEAEQMYERELERFLEAARGEVPYGMTFEDEKRILQILFAAEESAETGRRIELPPRPSAR
jgi:predicted dehydrogenase